MNQTIKNSILQGRLIGKFLANEKPESARADIDQWLAENPKNQKVLDELLDEKQLVSQLEEMDEVVVSATWNLLIQKSLVRQKEKMLGRWKIAAVIILLVGLGGMAAQFVFHQREHLPLSAMYTTVKTERGQTSKVILPDNTVVYLNSATELVYSNNFFVDSRNVKINGEAYFKVSKDSLHPFVVACDDVQVKVHGTEFNVRNDQENHTVDVILDEGSVELMHSQAKFQNSYLKPGERAKFDEMNNRLVFDDVDSYRYTSWKDGVLIFEDEPMREVFKKLEGWYDVDIQVDDEQIYDLKFNATIMDESLEELFGLIKYSCGIKYEIVYSRNPQISSKVNVKLK